jgi:GAF domain-containing protein
MLSEDFIPPIDLAFSPHWRTIARPSPMPDFSHDIALIGNISAVPTILDVICSTTGMGFAAIARVTDEHWVACSVLDQIQFGLQPGGELPIETTFCRDVRQSHEAVIIDHVDDDPLYQGSIIPQRYGFQSYISMPIFLADKSFYGTLCAIDPKPSAVKTHRLPH